METYLKISKYHLAAAIIPSPSSQYMLESKYSTLGIGKEVNFAQKH